MKKTFINFLSIAMVCVICQTAGAKVMTSEVKDAHIIDDTKMQTAAEEKEPLSLKQIEKRKREALKERQREERESFKEAQRKEQEEFEKAQKQAKENLELKKQKAKEDAKLLSEQKKLEKKQEIQNLKFQKEKAKQDAKLAKQKAKEELELAKQKEEERHEAEKQRLKEAERKLENPEKTEITANPNGEEAKKAQEIEEKVKEAKKIQKDSVEDIFGETGATTVSTGAKPDKNTQEALIPVEVTPQEEDIKPVKEEKEIKKEETPAITEPEAFDKEEEKQPAVYRKNLTYEDIDKNAVSINEFLQFTDEQNEKFSVYYYKTTSKLSAYNKAISNKEKEQQNVKTSGLSTEEQLTKLKKLKKETDNLYRLRDDFYNESLEKFNSMLNKKQRTKWEILQEMGYRFLPEIE